MKDQDIENLFTEVADKLSREKYNNEFEVSAVVNRTTIIRNAKRHRDETDGIYETLKGNQIQKNRSSKNTTNGYYVGGAMGAAGAAKMGYDAYKTVQNVSKWKKALDVGWGAVQGGIGGMLVGGLIGAAFSGLHNMLTSYEGDTQCVNDARFDHMRVYLRSMIKLDLKSLANTERTAREMLGALKAQITCPISHEKYTDPVVANDGQTYDRAYLQNWYNTGHRICPMNPNVRLTDPAAMVTSHSMKSIMSDYANLKARCKLYSNVREIIKRRKEENNGIGVHQQNVLDGRAANQNQQRTA